MPWYTDVVTYIIGMVSQKGGAGKSTMARLLARELAQNGMTVKIGIMRHRKPRNVGAADGSTTQQRVTGRAPAGSSLRWEARLHVTVLHGKQVSMVTLTLWPTSFGMVSQKGGAGKLTMAADCSRGSWRRNGMTVKLTCNSASWETGCHGTLTL